MRAKKKRLQDSHRRSLIFITLGVLLLCSVLIYKTVSLNEQATKYQASIEKYEKDMEDLEQEKEELEDLKEYVQSDAYVEDMAREKLGLVYEDEVIFEADQDK